MFAQPTYLYALWLLPVLIALRVLAQKRASTTASNFVSDRLRNLLIATTSPVHAWFTFGLQLLALTGFIGALAQPRWGEEKRTITESGKNIIIAIDTSKSMLADDFQPNRLMKAKLAAQDLLTTVHEHRVGLIAFAGTAYLQAPLTTDHDAVVESLQNFDTSTIPRGGSIISTAVKEAYAAFEKTQARNHGLIIFSDGAESDPDLEDLLAKAKEKHIIIITIGVGTETGALIPDPDPDHSGDYIRDPATGTPVHTKIEEATLRHMAEATGGTYLRLNGQTIASGIVTQVLDSLETQETGNREESKPIERFYWPLGVGMLCLMLALFMRPASRVTSLPSSAVTALIILLASTQTQASVLSSREQLEAAQQAYKEENWSRARDLYAELLNDNPPPGRAEELAYGLGVASEKLKEHDRAIDAFSRSLLSPNKDTQLRAHHSLGNTLWEQGAKALQQQPDYTVRAWVDSISHYESALAIRDDKDIRDNMEFVKKHLEEVKKKLGEEKKGKQKGDKSEKGDKGEKGDQEEEQPGDKSDEKKDGDKADKKEGDQKDGEKKGDQKGDQQQPGDKEGGEQQQDKQGQGEGEQMEKKEGEQVPEGQIQAGQEGKPNEKQMREALEKELAEEKSDDKTGFSRNEARNLLRAYSDQMQLQFQRRHNDRNVKRDW